MPAHRKELNIQGSDLWYLVGLITTDGCLSSDGRHIDITSKDYDFLRNIKKRFNINNNIGEKYNAVRQKSFHVQIGNKNFYNFLLSIGLMPNKSLVLKEIKVPEQVFADFFRGVIDGDGCIRRWIHPSNKREQWSLRVYSGSEQFIQWLKSKTEKIFKVRGRIYENTRNVWALKYGKMAARELTAKCYYKDCFGLDRKIKLAQDCLNSFQGWNKSKTVICS